MLNKFCNFEAHYCYETFIQQDNELYLAFRITLSYIL